MATKKAAPAPEGTAPEAPRENGGKKKPPIGRRFYKGGPPGPGRPAIPREFKDSAWKSLEIVERVALTGFFDRAKKMPAMPSIRWRAIERHLDTTFNIPGKARVEGDALPSNEEDLIKMLEAKVAEAAIAGNDSEAAVRMLEALAPEKWGKRLDPNDDGDENDIVDWTPMVKGEPGPGGRST